MVDSVKTLWYSVITSLSKEKDKFHSLNTMDTFKSIGGALVTDIINKDRVILSGSHCTGKTTMMHYLKNELNKTKYKVAEFGLTKAEFREEPVRWVNSFGFPINEAATEATQLAMAAYHWQTQTYQAYIADRSIIDVLAYATYINRRNKDLISDNCIKLLTDMAEEFMSYFDGVVFLFRPMKGAIKDDGFRDTNKAFQEEIDLLLYQYWSQGVLDGLFTAVSVSESNFGDRVKFIKNFLGMSNV